MAALSIILPEKLAKNSAAVAKYMHLSRSQFIRQAIENEIKAFYKKRDQLAMAEGLKAVKKNPAYLKELRALEALDAPIEDKKKE